MIEYRIPKIKIYKFKKTEKEQIMHIMYRKPFASGSVFSDALIETLVSLAFRKPYMIELIRLLIGITYSEGSGNLKSV
jgi:potassium channel subfamily T protein 1